MRSIEIQTMRSTPIQKPIQMPRSTEMPIRKMRWTGTQTTILTMRSTAIRMPKSTEMPIRKMRSTAIQKLR
ncbi:MAG: hypothetical protein JRE40_14945 [Deltaproteobacteria bacterium]|nr:hypothetical protein [Deltaproteobacteria bacterium]